MNVAEFKEALQQREEDLSSLVDEFIKEDVLAAADTSTSTAVLDDSYLPDMDFQDFEKIMTKKGFEVKLLGSSEVIISWE